MKLRPPNHNKTLRQQADPLTGTVHWLRTGCSRGNRKKRCLGWACPTQQAGLDPQDLEKGSLKTNNRCCIRTGA